MRYYFAPMEGLTDSIYRQLHHQYFGGVDRYYMPFFSPTIHQVLTHREARELPLADSVGFDAVPQVLTKNVDDFLWAANTVLNLGYPELNLNAGCPSGTVVSKGKGSGLLSDTDQLKHFLDGIFANVPLKISVKTRLGMKAPEEFFTILDIYNQYPIHELIIHPRVRKEFYNGSVHMEIFRYAAEYSRIPLCYNGDIVSMKQLSWLEAQFPKVDAVMLGRGLIGNPGLLCSTGTTAPALEAFFDELLDRYTECFGGARNAMFRLKENWSYLLPLLEDSDKLGKRLRKTTDVREYREITHILIREHRILQDCFGTEV